MPLVDLPNVVHDAPAAILLIDTETATVVFVNDRARQLAPQVPLPLSVEAWSRAAGLQALPTNGSTKTPDPGEAGETGHVDILTGRPSDGSSSVLLHRLDATGRDAEAFLGVGVTLHDVPASLRARAMLVLMPVRLPSPALDRSGPPGAPDSVLAGSLAMAISDPALEDNPLVWISPSFEHVTGYPVSDALGRNCRFLQGRDTDPATVAHLRGEILAERTVSTILLNYRRDGSAFYNHLIVSPVFDAEGDISHHVSVQSDVTQQVLTARERDQARVAGEAARVAGEQAREAGERAREARKAAEEAERFGRLLLTLSEALAAAITVEDVAKTVTDVVAAELGAAGGGLMLADQARTRLDYVSMQAMPPGTDAAWSRIDWAEDAPPAVAVRTRRAVFHRDSASMSVAHPGIEGHAAVPSMGATVNLPLIAGDEVIGAVFLFWERPQDLPPAQRVALEALGRYAAQAVQRASLFAQRRTAAEVLQQSLLTRLPEPDHLELRARYVPAAVGEHVGGDWYDAVVLPEGSTTLVIGDVTGHDIAAAARMGQLRGLLRAYVVDHPEPPAETLTRLEQAHAALGLEGLATLVLARIEQGNDDRRQGLRWLRWTNAGHPPPILLHLDGTTELLERAPELLVGLLPGVPRTDHLHLIPPGSTVLLYTDGLIEHRGRSLDEGIEDLRRALSRHAGSSLEELLDRLVAELIGDRPDDDCAILAVRAHPEDRPRPVEAGPNRA